MKKNLGAAILVLLSITLSQASNSNKIIKDYTMNSGNVSQPTEDNSINDKIQTDDSSLEEAQKIFDELFSELIAQKGEDGLIFPERMIWLNGAPGAGKGTNTASIMRIFEISSKPVEVSSLLTSPEAQKIKESGKLVDDKTVIHLVFQELLRPENAKDIIIDGFPRTKVQAQCLKLLIQKLQTNERNKWCKFTIINFIVSRETSVERQLARGRSSIEHNRIVEESNIGEKVHVRATDIDRDAANLRYQTYLDETQASLSILKDLVEYDEINTEGSIDEVRERIYRVITRN